MATQVASLLGVLELDDSKFKAGLESARSGMSGLGDGISSAGRRISRFGRQLTLFTAPLALGLGLATNMALDFSQSMTNAASILGLTQEEMAGLRDEVLAIGAASTVGPQAAADAFYNIVSGVQDATTHMDILRSSIRLAEAGQAELTTTTAGLVAAMNAYQFAAEDATFVADVYTRTVQKGVGTMDEFVAALSPVAGLAATVGIGFEELGGAAAFLTSQGASASEAATQLQSVMIAFLRPNQDMQAALEQMGFTSGLAALETLGLQGAIEALNIATGGLEGNLADTLGRQEALRASTALLKEEAPGFMDDYIAGLDGATDAAREIQAQDPAFVFAELRSAVSGVAVAVGLALLPTIQDLAADLVPVISSISEWIQANPELTKKILMFTIALIALGPVLSGVGATLTIVGSGAKALTVAFGLLSSPLLVVIGLGIALGIALNELAQALGFEDAIDFVATGLDNLNTIIREAKRLVGALTDKLNLLGDQVGIVGEALNLIVGPTVATAIDAEISQGNLDLLDAVSMAVLGWRPFQAGGRPAVGVPAVVGEEGPELFVPDVTGTIIPNDQLGGMFGGGVSFDGAIFTIFASGEMEGRAAARGFKEELTEALAAVG